MTAALCFFCDMRAHSYTYLWTTVDVQGESAEALFHDAGVLPLPRVCSVVGV